jgi:hypothetical protein
MIGETLLIKIRIIILLEESFCRIVFHSSALKLEGEQG